MENPMTPDCPYEGEREVRSLYLAGKLPEKEAEAFEAHYFECERCAEAVELGAKLRMAFENVPAHAAPAAPAPARATRTWLPLAAAAAIALVAVGVWRFTRQPLEPAFRSGSAQAPVVGLATNPNGGWQVTWTADPAAAAYVVRVLTLDGAEVWKTETARSTVTVAPAVLSAAAGKPLLVEVEALDAGGRVISSSEPARMK